MNENNTDARKAGYYWVKRDGVWLIAKYSKLRNPKGEFIWRDMVSRFTPEEIDETPITRDDNNGWIRIEANGSNLPTNGEFECYLLTDEKSINQGIHLHEFVSYYFRNKAITHYRPIEKRKPPIF